MKLLVTGANGFVGRAVCAEATARGWSARCAVRAAASAQSGLESVAVGDLDGQTDWSAALSAQDVVVHAAARVHVMERTNAEQAAEFQKVNVEATLRLARHAAAAGVRRLVFLSTIKVNGEGGGTPYCESDTPAPQDAYGRSKADAESGLRKLAEESGLEVVILRPPMVYGTAAKGNFFRLARILAWGVPLPLAGIRNRRSLLYLGNLVDAILLCATHPAAAGRTYLLCDGEDLSTPDLIRRLAGAMGRRERLFTLPASLLRAFSGLVGQESAIARLTDSLTIDSSLIQRELGWRPPFSVDEGLRAAIIPYRKNCR